MSTTQDRRSLREAVAELILLAKEVGDAWFDVNEAAYFLRCTPKSLENLRARSEGPAWTRLPNRRVRYQFSSILAWTGDGQ